VRNPRDIVSRMQDFCGFLAGLGKIPPQVLIAPMAEGKWSVQEVVAHIMAYDEAFLQSAVLAIEYGRQPLVPDSADNQSFNDRAAALGRNLTKGQLLEKATLARRQLVDHLRRLPAEAFRVKQQGPPESDLAELLDKDFVSHDRIHIKQMQKYLKNRGYLRVALPGGGTAH
jgi:DinB superfamily